MHNIKYHRYISKSYSIPQSDITKSLEKNSSENVSDKTAPGASKSEEQKKRQVPNIVDTLFFFQIV